MNSDQHAIFGGIAAGYCLFLAAFSLFQSRSKINLLFAGYNISNAFWNAADPLYIFDKGTGQFEWVLKFIGLGGCFFIPFVLHFGYEISGVSDRKFAKRILGFFYGLGLIFSILHQTPLLHTTALYNYKDKGGYWSSPGPLYPLFSIYILVGLICLATPLPFLLKRSQGLKRKQISYLIFACLIGMIGLIFFFLSFFSYDWPWIYYSLQALVGFIFSYTIFQHNLIHLSVALRRAVLLSGLYILIALTVTPFATFFYQHYLNSTNLTVSGFIAALFSFSCLISIAPTAYSYFVRRSSFFQDQSVWQITHELKTPLATIQSAKQILEEEFKKEKFNAETVRNYMNMIESNTNRLAHFVQQILDYGRVDQGNPSEFKTELELTSFFRGILEQFPSDSNRIEYAGESPFYVKASEEGLKHIMTNLISNAVKFSNGPILVTASTLKEVIQISVEDQGKGIKKQDLEKIFIPFSLNSKDKKQSKGTGLGLSIAKKWVEAHGGHIWAESEGEGKGMKVTFTLPTK